MLGGLRVALLHCHVNHLAHPADYQISQSIPKGQEEKVTVITKETVAGQWGTAL